MADCGCFWACPIDGSCGVNGAKLVAVGGRHFLDTLLMYLTRMCEQPEHNHQTTHHFCSMPSTFNTDTIICSHFPPLPLLITEQIQSFADGFFHSEGKKFIYPLECKPFQY